ncbi:rho-N domain-containing protein 1, chloroplastic isoform X2 [Corylus avellana]|uniref:rho-N domain-containing protein 1, chloroplastic isoform X2 n=1 Tax=Corylus avellana TaxID=13451 RepID=UPI00286C880A|nr:rho-N domain-containing protein 1, chloroplastic isoform X2 [Corylus avellana]
MSQAVGIISKNVPGYGVVDGRCLPCSGVSGRAATISPSSSRFDCRLHSQVKIRSLKCASKGAAFVCKASSSGHRRNPDFSRQNRHSYSRNRNRQNEERESFDNLNESDMLSSKNGPLLSLSSAPKFYATSAPGPREKEIVELFRKVQAQLRERAASKEEKKTEALQGQGKESETVDSLLKLLRKHSVEQNKRSSRSNSSNKNFSLEQPVQNDPYNEGKSTSYNEGKSTSYNEGKGTGYNEGKSTSFYNSNSSLKSDAQEPDASLLSRPLSNFRRKSPVPRVKYQPIYSGEDPINSMPHVNSSEKREENQVESDLKAEQELEPDLEAEPMSEPELELEPEPEPKVTFPDGGFAKLSEGETSDTDEPCNDKKGGMQLTSEHGDLSALKLPELRALAKSRGVKGYSKMKKSELVELLTGSFV